MLTANEEFVQKKDWHSHTSPTYCPSFFDCLCEDTQCIMKWPISFIQDLLCGPPDYNGTCLIQLTAGEMDQLLKQRKTILKVAECNLCCQQCGGSHLKSLYCIPVTFSFTVCLTCLPGGCHSQGSHGYLHAWLASCTAPPNPRHPP